MIGTRLVSKAYANKVVLANITLSFESGTVSGLVGGNGAGKSTLLRILSGATLPSSGSVLISGVAGKRSIRQTRTAGVWMADQEGSLIPAWTVGEHFVRLAGIVEQEPWRELLPEVSATEFVRDLPQAERQLIEIALVSAGGQTAALFDEPTAGQGSNQKERIIHAMKRAATLGAAVVWVTHDLKAVLAQADRIIALRNGSVIADVEPGETTMAEILAAFPLVERPVEVGPSQAPPGPAETRLRIRFDDNPGAPIEIHAGEIVGLVSNGTSKTRNVLRAASGLPGSHSFRIELADPRQIAYMSRERDIDWDFTGQSLEFNLIAGVLGQIAHNGVIDERPAVRIAASLKQDFFVEAETLDMPIENLSGGNRQKALLARLTSMKREVLLLDEPFSGVDEPTRAALRPLLRRIAGNGVAVAIYSQEWDDLIQAADRVVVVRDDHQLVTLSRATASEALIESVLGRSTASASLPEIS